jgi:hypothetical protein
MSYDFIVYTQINRVPEPDRLAAEVSVHAPWLALAPFDLRVDEGYVPLASTGFEVSRSPVTSKDVEDYRELLRDEVEADDDEYIPMLLESDTTITFWCRDNAEISAARVVAGALAKLSNGFVCDPQFDITVRGDYLPQGSVSKGHGAGIGDS